MSTPATFNNWNLRAYSSDWLPIEAEEEPRPEPKGLLGFFKPKKPRQ